MFLENCPDFWGSWNHASLTSIAKRNAEIKIGIRKGFSIKGAFALRKTYNLERCKRDNKYQEADTAGMLAGDLISWLWLKSEIFPKHLKFLHPYLLSHPRPLGKSFSNFLWEEMIHLGICNPQQGDVTVEYKKTQMRFRWKVESNHVYGVATRIKGTGKLQLETIGTDIYFLDDCISEFEENHYKIHLFEDKIHFSTDRNADKDSIIKIISSFNKNNFPVTSGTINQTAEALTTVIGINSLKTPDRGWLTTLMRRMGVLLNGWSIFQWDTSFVGMMSTIHYPKIAAGNFNAICSELTKKGFIPNQAHPMGRAEAITQLPVTSYCALKAKRTLSGFSQQNQTFLDIQENLKTNNDWWIKNRDPNNFHILSYGSELSKRCASVLRQNALYESGMDNHPMFDNVPMDYNSGCIAMYNVDLNSIYALDCEALANFAESYGDQLASKKYRSRYERMKHVINKYLWDGNCYRNRYWSGDFHLSNNPNLLFPLMAGIPTQKQAESCVKQVFKKCLTPFGIAPTSKDDPAFTQQILWRGRILPPIQFLVSESLRRYEFDIEASNLAKRCYRTFYKEWNEESHFHETYNAMTGEGDDTSISGEPMHPWAGLLPYLSIQDFADYEVWNKGIRLGRLLPTKASLENIPIHGNKYSISIDNNKQMLSKDGVPILNSNQPCILRKFEYIENNNSRGNKVSFDQKGLKNTEIRLKLKPGEYRVQINDEIFSENVQKGDLTISVGADKNRVLINTKKN